jgi:hypothetical protein
MFVEILIRLFPPRCGGMTAILPRHPRALRSAERAAHSQSLIARSWIASAHPLPLPPAPLAQRAIWGKGRNAPGHHSRAHARFWNIPRQFTLVNRRSPLASPQSPGKLQELTFDVFTLPQPVAHRNKKHAHSCEQPVDEAPSLWKLEEKWKINLCRVGVSVARPYFACSRR